MDEHYDDDLEQDPRFPSGAWTGYFLQYWLPGRHKMDLQLTCRDGQLTGNGSDWVGSYTIEGQYDLQTGQCEWLKRYVGKHSIAYKGVGEARGVWGVWVLKQLWGLFLDRGGFYIWPEGADTGSESDEVEQALLEVMRKQFGNRAVRTIRNLILIAAIGLGIALTLKVICRF